MTLKRLLRLHNATRELKTKHFCNSSGSSNSVIASNTQNNNNNNNSSSSSSPRWNNVSFSSAESRSNMSHLNSVVVFLRNHGFVSGNFVSSSNSSSNNSINSSSNRNIVAQESRCSSEVARVGVGKKCALGRSGHLNASSQQHNNVSSGDNVTVERVASGAVEAMNGGGGLAQGEGVGENRRRRFTDVRPTLRSAAGVTATSKSGRGLKKSADNELADDLEMFLGINQPELGLDCATTTVLSTEQLEGSSGAFVDVGSSSNESTLTPELHSHQRDKEGSVIYYYYYYCCYYYL